MSQEFVSMRAAPRFNAIKFLNAQAETDRRESVPAAASGAHGVDLRGERAAAGVAAVATRTPGRCSCQPAVHLANSRQRAHAKLLPEKSAGSTCFSSGT